MPCYIRMKRTFLQGLLWLYLLGFGFMALSLEPGVSLFLDFDNLPDTNFSCVGKVIGGYYADLETNCQMFHVCTIGQLDEPMDIRFLCLNGTVFDQETRVCERIDEVDCSKSEQFYSLNLELYGNTQPATLEESPETEPPLIIKSTTTTPKTTTTSAPKTSRTPYYTTATTPRATTPGPQVISTHHFPVVNSPDIRFNPEEINISLHPGAPPDIRTKPAGYRQHGYSDSNQKVIVTAHSDNSDKVLVTTHATLFDVDDGKVSAHQEQGFIERPQVQKVIPVHGYAHSDGAGKNFNRPTPSDINFGFTFHQTEASDEYHTEEPQEYHFHSDYRPSQDYSGLRHQFKSSTFQDDYTTTTSKVNNFQQKSPTTIKNYFIQSLTPPAPNQHHHYNQHRTDKPQRLQLPLPLLPTLPPLIFSSPAPFALQRHIETKRYTKDHQAPPRIIISASASVSDASGRRLNYSLGTIGAGEILEDPPSSYDEYKDSDVGLDPFYHDVPKLKRSRQKREAGAKIKHSDIIRNEQEAVDVLKFLLDWYKNNEKTVAESTTVPTIPSSTTISIPIQEEKEKDLATEDTINFKNSELFDKNSKYSIIGTHETDKEGIATYPSKNRNKNKSSIEKDFFREVFHYNEDYVNDNYEPITYQDKYGKGQDKSYVKSIKLLHEETKNKSLPLDYVDDNIEPIYYRDKSINDRRSSEDKKNKKDQTGDTETNNIDKIASRIDLDIKEINDALLFPKVEENSKVLDKSREPEVNIVRGEINFESKELNDALLAPVVEENKEEKSGDSETNTINKKINQETTEYRDLLITPQPDSTTVTIVTTEKATTLATVRSRNGRRKGRRRFYNNNNNNDSSKNKEPDYRNVVIEKITEKAHTAKDDFNYLRTLYKVLSTTPMSHVSDEASPHIKHRKIPNNYWDDRDYFSQNVDAEDIGSHEDKKHSESQNVPIVTTERIITSTISSKRPTNRRRGRNREQNRRRPDVNRRRTTTTQPTTKAPTEETKTAATEPDIELIDPRDINSLEDTRSKEYIIPNTNYFVPRTELPVTTVTPVTEVETQTTFFTELTHNYKRLFEVLTSTAPTDAQPTGSLESTKIFATPRYATTESLNEILLRERTTTESPTERSITTTSSPSPETSTSATTVRPQRSTEFSKIPSTTLATQQQESSTTTSSERAFTIPTTLSELYKEVNIENLNGKILLQTIKNDVTSTTESYKIEKEIPSTTKRNIQVETENYPTELNAEATTTEVYNTEKVPTTQLTTERSAIDDETETNPPDVLPTQHVLKENRHFRSSFTQSFIFTEESKDLNESEMDTEQLPTTTVQEDSSTENPERKRFENVHVTEETTQTVRETESYPSTVVETTTPVIKYLRIEEIFPTTQQMTEKMEDYIKEIEASTKSIAVGTETPLVERIVKTVDTTHMADNLQDLVAEIQDMTKSKIGTTTLEIMTKKTKEESSSITETDIPSTVEDTTLPVTNVEETTLKSEAYTYENIPTTQIERFTTETVPTTTEKVVVVTTTTSEKTTTEERTTSTKRPTTTAKRTTTTEKPTTTERRITTTERQTTERTTTDEPTTMTTNEATTTTTTVKPVRVRVVGRRGNRRGTTKLPTKRPPANSHRNTTRHRFSTETFTKRPEGRRQTIEEEILDEIVKNSQEATTEPLRPARRRQRKRKRIDTEEHSTDAPLHKSASPTKAERARQSLPTTPLSKTLTPKTRYIFNCFGKKMDKFYPDPRDCRLFHYCTQGYSKNQLLDMKFVCDHNTYFDDEKLICTKRKPRRCL